MATTLELLTAEEYAKLPDTARPTELVRGRVVEMNLPGTQHGKICNLIGRFLGNFVADHDLGNVINNDSGVITKRNPDSVRGPDVSFYSYARWSKGPVPDGYLPVVPEIVVEVLSPDDRWSDVHEKIAEYLNAGVSVVCVVDPKTRSAYLSYPDRPATTLASSDDLAFPEIQADFSVPVARLFE